MYKFQFVCLIRVQQSWRLMAARVVLSPILLVSNLNWLFEISMKIKVIWTIKIANATTPLIILRYWSVETEFAVFALHFRLLKIFRAKGHLMTSIASSQTKLAVQTMAGAWAALCLIITGPLLFRLLTSRLLSPCWSPILTPFHVTDQYYYSLMLKLKRAFSEFLIDS